VTTPEVTVGIDIGTSSVKAVAADGYGAVVASARVAHGFAVPSPGRFEHDAALAWRAGPRAALAALGDLRVRGVSVAAMVPSLTAVDVDGMPVLPGLLYGDERGRSGATPGRGAPAGLDDLLGFVRFAAVAAPDAHGYWPAQAVANHALSGAAVLDTSTAATAYPLFDLTSWDETVASGLGVRADQLPRLVPTGWLAACVDGDGPALASGCIDALAEQLVAGADDDGDVLVVLGTTLLVWVVTSVDVTVPGYLTIPHTAPGKLLVGGPSNAGGLFCDWAGRLLGSADGAVEPHAVPVWAPYPRGERVPIDDPGRRAVLADLDLTHGAGAARRAAYEATGFVVRRVVDAARAHGVAARRVVASGGGTRDDAWVRAVADATGLPVDCVAVPEGAALGSAWLARIAAELEPPAAVADGRRWARVGRTVEPDPQWVPPVSERYERFLAMSGSLAHTAGSSTTSPG
jgi:xylulokinase